MVDWIKTNYALSNVNALMGSMLGYQQDRQSGLGVGDATMNFGLNVVNGAMRNDVAYDMRRCTGSNLGFLINGMAGYGNQEANAKGTMGLMAASFLTPFMSPYSYGCGPFGGSMFGGFMGGGYMGGCCGGGMMMPYPMMQYGAGRFYC